MSQRFFGPLRRLVIAMSTLSTLLGQDPSTGQARSNGVKVSVELKPSPDKTGWTIDFTVENDRPEAVYVMVDPVRSNGEKGYYFQSVQADPTLLEITSQIYRLPPYFLYIDKSRVRLVRLEPGQKHNGAVSFRVPDTETMPP